MNDLVKVFWSSPLLEPSTKVFAQWGLQSLDTIDSFLFKHYIGWHRTFDNFCQAVLGQAIFEAYL